MIKTNSSLLLLAFIIVPLTPSANIKQVLLLSRYFRSCLVPVLGRVSLCKQRRLTQGWSRCGAAGHSSDRQMNGQLSSEMETILLTAWDNSVAAQPAPTVIYLLLVAFSYYIGKLNSPKDNPFHASVIPLTWVTPDLCLPLCPLLGAATTGSCILDTHPQANWSLIPFVWNSETPFLSLPPSKCLHSSSSKMYWSKIINCVYTCEPLFISSLHAVVFPLKTTHNMVHTLKNILYQGAFIGKMVSYLQVKCMTAVMF